MTIITNLSALPHDVERLAKKKTEPSFPHFFRRCDGVHGEGGGLYHLLLKERDVQLLQGGVFISKFHFFIF